MHNRSVTAKRRERERVRKRERESTRERERERERERDQQTFTDIRRYTPQLRFRILDPNLGQGS